MNRNPMPRTAAALALLVVTSANASDPWEQSAHGSDFADPVSGAVGGGVVGGIAGGIIAGGTGAAVGAVLGGTSGAIAGAHLQKQQQAQAAYGEQAEWERERRRHQQQLAEQRQTAWIEGVGDSQTSAAASVVGSVTAGGSTAAASSSPSADADPTVLLETQRSLIRLGYDPGDLGTLNRQTIATIKIYQAQHGMPETGQPSQTLLKHMIRNGG